MRFVGLASLVLATALGASNASAGFLLIDDFDDTNTPTGLEGGRLITGIGTVSGGSFSIVNAAAGTTQSLEYVMNNFDLAGNRKLLLDGVSATAGTFIQAVVTRSVGGNLTQSYVATGSETSILFDMNGSLDDVTSVKFNFGAFLGTYSFSASSLQAVPEPTTLALIGLVGAGGGVAGWRRRRAAKA